MYCLRQLPRAAAGAQAIDTALQEHTSSTTTGEHGGGAPVTAGTVDGQTFCPCTIAPGTTLTLHRHAGSDGYVARVIADGSAFVLTASLAAETRGSATPETPGSAGPAAAAGTGSSIASALGAACEPGAPACSQRTALRVTTADGAWVQADTNGAVTMVGPASPGPPAQALEANLSADPSRAWRAVLPGGATAQGWADGRVRVLHPDGSASLRLPRGWGPGLGTGSIKGSGQPVSGTAAADEVSAHDAAAICDWAAALLSGTPWPPHADNLSDSGPELDPLKTPSKLEPLPAAVWVRINSGGQRWAELDPLEVLSLKSPSPPPPLLPSAEAPPQPVVPAPGAPAKLPFAKAGAQGAKAATPPGTGKAPGAGAKPAGEERAADGKPQAVGAAAPPRSVEPRRSALQAPAAPEAPAEAEQPSPAPRWLLLPPVPTESAADADTGCLIRARADGVLALAYPNGDRLVTDADGARVKFAPERKSSAPNGDRLVRDADGARVKFMAERKAADPSKSAAGVPAALPESWAAEAAGFPAVTGSAAGMQVRAHVYICHHDKSHVFCCVSGVHGAVLPCGELSVLLST